MARNYGRTVTSIWRDKDFRRLSPEARFVYLMLFNQPNISPAGVLELTVTRWAGNTGYSTEQIRMALKELQESDQRYVVVDEDTEELFVRSFARHDGGANNDLRRKAICDSAGNVVSDEIRASIAPELDRLNIPHSLSIGPREGFDTRRVVVNKGDHLDNPQPTTTNPESGIHEGEPDALGAGSEPPSMFCSKHPNGTEKSCGPCGTARKRYAAWMADQTQRVLEARHQLAQAAADCVMCDEHGIRIDPDSLLPVGRCDHQPHEAA